MSSTENELAEALMAAWKAGTLREFFIENFPHLSSAERTARVNELKVKLDVPDEVAAKEYRLQQAQRLMNHYKAGTLREFLRDEHSDWNADKVEHEATRIEAYFDTLKFDE